MKFRQGVDRRSVVCGGDRNHPGPRSVLGFFLHALTVIRQVRRRAIEHGSHDGFVRQRQLAETRQRGGEQIVAVAFKRAGCRLERKLRLKPAFIQHRAVRQIINPLRNAHRYVERQVDNFWIAAGAASMVAHRRYLRVAGHHADERFIAAHAFLADE